MELARALDELYAGTPDQFTSRRDAIVKEMKAAGDKDAAAQLAKRRKPTQVAYVLNQLARLHPDEVASFVDVGRDLARAHRKALRGGGGAELAKAMAAQRKAVKELTALVGDVVQELAANDDSDVGGVSDAVLAEVAGALQAALVDPRAAAALEEGQLEKAPDAPAMLGFGAEEVEEVGELEEVGEIEEAEEVHQAPRPAQRARPERRAPTTRARPAQAHATTSGRDDDAAAKRARAKQERERAKEEREREKAAQREQEKAERKRAKQERERADLEAAAERADAVAKERTATAKELADEAERLEQAARALAAQARAALDEAERAKAEAIEARARVPRARRAR
jgi:hypothetical protein